MSLLQEFPQILVKSISSREFYQSALKDKFSRALGYFLILTILLAIFKSVAISFAVIPALSQFVDKVATNIVNLYPSDLSVTIEGGKLTTNAKQPYLIPVSNLDKILPQAKSDINPTNQPEPENLLVIDTNASPSDFPKYKTDVLVTKTGFVISDNQTSGYRFYPFSSDTNVTIDRRYIRSLWSQFSPYTKWIVPVVTAVIWIGLLLWYPSWYSTYLLVGALLLKLILKISGTSLSYGSLYKVGLYSMTLPILVIYFIDGFGISVPFLFTIIFLTSSLMLLRTPNKLQH